MDLHRIYEQQLDIWFHALLSPEAQQRIIADKLKKPEGDVIVFAMDETDDSIIWN